MIGDVINFFEKSYYKDSVMRGLFLVIFVLSVVFIVAELLMYLLSSLPYVFTLLFSSIIASMFIAHKMLYDSVKDILTCKDKKKAISMLVSRDTKDMTKSDINKAAIETYAENLSDGVIAPLFYLLFFNLAGIMLYKAVNTLDSMVGYRNEKYENFGKVAAILDDILNFIPSRITAILIMVASSQKDIFSFYIYGKKHESPNAGHPISAMALAIDVKLGGDTYYFGKLKSKPYFGKGRKVIEDADVLKALEVL